MKLFHLMVWEEDAYVEAEGFSNLLAEVVFSRASRGTSR
jgi:hypothetical protein